MMHTSRIVAALLLALAGLAVLPALAQAPPPGPGAPPPRPRAFVDWPGGDLGALRTEVPFIEFVADLEAADVEVAVRPQASPDGERFSVAFTGLKRFQGDDNAIAFVPAPGARPEDVRSGLVGTIKLGLLRYAAKTPVARDLSVRFLDQAKPTAVDDPWNSWIFSLSGNAFLMGETQYRSGSYFASVSANRVRPELKIQTSVYYNQNDTWFDFGDGTFYDSSTHGFGASALVVKSLGEHWSAGGYAEAESSTYSNLDLGFTIAPAVEYNLFPYSESTKRQFRILYRLGYTYARYIEETIYFKTSENLLQEALSCAYEVVRPWGNVTVRLEGSHYFHDFSKNRLELGTELDIRIWRGLSFEIDAEYARIHDQLSLPAGGASYEEILLRQKQLATGYDYQLSVGFNFSFGSTRSNVVNPRFGNGGRSISIHM
ncbi:MAG: hypothetical protein H6P96_1246 [Candidatus Aminicenantes bacterium]|nr:hypothetical protein [Candidatus Aminicenantes bacterium]MBP1770628.1 hypothetical protein [Candidatus Aminicenantes bacterium]